VDVLSEVLRSVKLQGALYFNGEFSAPWRVTARNAEIAPLVCPGSEHLIVYHFLTEGRAYAELPDGERTELEAGDIVIFPHGDTHVIGNGEPATVDAAEALAPGLGKGLKLTRFGGGGAVTKFVCGYLACQPLLTGMILAGLPRLMKVRIGEDAGGQWVRNSIQFLAVEESQKPAGSKVVTAKLAEVLLIETLRRYVNELAPEQKGWLAAVGDRAVGTALGLLHQYPAKDWTVQGLAKSCGLSRTRLAERFRSFVGQSPMAYLGEWRVRLGAEMLMESEISVAEIAGQVGYGSEAAFNRAFRRQFGSPPAQFRKTRVQSAGSSS
jgi:AraC-like DNA-binding protein